MQSRSLINDPKRWRFTGDTYYVMTYDEMRAAFQKNGHQALDQKIVDLAIDTTVEIADQCNLELTLNKTYLPVVKPPEDNIEFNNWANKRKKKFPDETQSARYMRYLCIKGLKSKGLTSQEYRDRLEFEIEVINKMGFPDYFLIMEDIMKFCANAGIPVGPARGCWEKGSRVYANDTIKNIEDIKVGDIVQGHDEQYHKVNKLWEYEIKEELVKLETENNKKLKCTKDHKIYAIKKEDWDKGIRIPQWYKADELQEDDYIAELE